MFNPLLFVETAIQVALANIFNRFFGKPKQLTDSYRQPFIEEAESNFTDKIVEVKKEYNKSKALAAKERADAVVISNTKKIYDRIIKIVDEKSEDGESDFQFNPDHFFGEKICKNYDKKYLDDMLIRDGFKVLSGYYGNYIKVTWK